MSYRHTKNFTIETSYDMNNWDMVVSDQLKKPPSECDIEIEKFGTGAHGRYMRYTSVDFYGSIGGGLNYMSWEFVLS